MLIKYEKAPALLLVTLLLPWSPFPQRTPVDSRRALLYGPGFQYGRGSTSCARWRSSATVALALHSESRSAPEAPARDTQRNFGNPLDLHLQSVRQKLAQTRAAMALLNERSIQSNDEGRQLVVEVNQLRMDIAVILQQLNLQQPDGGSRLSEAEEHYRAVLSSLDSLAAPSPAPPGSSGLSSSASPDLLATRLRLRGNLAALLLEADRPAAAMRELDGALQLAVAGPEGLAPGLLCGLRFNRGKSLAAMGRTAEADAAYLGAAEGAIGHEPGCFAKACAAMTRLPDSLLSFVQSSVQLAEDSGLRQRFLSATESGAGPAAAPPGPDATLGTRRGDRITDAPGRLSDLAAGGGDPFGDRSSGGWLAGIGVSELGWLYFAWFKALDDRGAEAPDVWRVLEQANALLSTQQPYDPTYDWQQLSTLTGVFRAPLLAAAAGAGVGVADPTPVFVVGLPRSGSTLVETILARHPGVWAAGEDTALAPLTPAVNHVLTSKGLSQPAALTDIGRRYLEDMGRRAVAAGWDPSRPPVRIVDKMLRNLWLVNTYDHLGYVEMLLPRACIVHVVRHPLDVALSCYSQPFGYSGVPWSWRLQHIGEQIRMAGVLAAHWREHLPEGRVLTLHYEEVVAAPEASSRRLLAHCGLDWDAGVLDFHTATRTVATASVAQVRRPLYNTSVGRWRKYEQQLAELAEQIRPEISSYEVELTDALRAAEAETRRLGQAAQQHRQHWQQQGAESTRKDEL